MSRCRDTYLGLIRSQSVIARPGRKSAEPILAGIHRFFSFVTTAIAKGTRPEMIRVKPTMRDLLS